MTKNLLVLGSVFLLGACAYTCSGQFEDANKHLLTTAESVYAARSSGSITTEESMSYQLRIEDAYTDVSEGSALCDTDEEAAAAKFDEAEDALDAIDNEL